MESKDLTKETTILFVDDEEVIRKSFTRELQMEHFAVTAVASGSEALRALEGKQYDLVITDLMMPDVDGFGVLKATKKLAPLTSVIILTGYGDMQSAIDALRLGADDFARKPCEVEELIFRIRRCMDKRNLLLGRKRSEEALREREERHRSILNASPDGIVITDMEGQVLMISPKGLTMFGYDPKDKGQGHMITDFIAPAYRDHLLSNFSIKADGLMSGPDEYLGLRKNGTTFAIEVNSDFIRSEDGQPDNTVFVVRDITERKRAEEEKMSLQAQLIHAQKMEAIGTLAGGIAHDFNNLLSLILGYTEMARAATPPDSLVAQKLEKVLEAGQRSVALVKQILAFSHRTDTERIPLNPVHIVKEAIKLLRPSLPSTIVIRQQIDTSNRQILADPTQIHQILMNLCTNAFHAMEQTGGALEITLKDCELSQSDLHQHPEVSPGSFVVLSISDTGTGIDPEISDKIFDPYFTTKAIGKGTGMGLAIVHGIITSYGGFITSKNNVGNGTVFQVFFPAVKEGIGPEIKPVEAAPPGTGHILLVDDEVMLAELDKEMLEQLGYEITVQTSSLEALAAFRDQPNRFDAVITDQTMPGMTGIDLAKQMLQIRSDIPIILCTGYSTLVSEEQAKTEGIREFAIKPLSKTKIALLLKKILTERKTK